MKKVIFSGNEILFIAAAAAAHTYVTKTFVTDKYHIHLWKEQGVWYWRVVGWSE